MSATKDPEVRYSPPPLRSRRRRLVDMGFPNPISAARHHGAEVAIPWARRSRGGGSDYRRRTSDSFSHPRLSLHQHAAEQENPRRRLMAAVAVVPLTVIAVAAITLFMLVVRATPFSL